MIPSPKGAHPRVSLVDGLRLDHFAYLIRAELRHHAAAVLDACQLTLG
jgi:hypothetical protein